MKFLWTNFRSLLQKFRAASLLNIVGLAVALAIVIIVAIQVKWDLTYDRGYKNADRILTTERYNHSTGTRMRTLTMQIAQQMLDQIPEVETYAMTQGYYESNFGRQENGAVEQHSITKTQARGDFFGVFTPRIVAGDTTGLFEAPEKAMLSRKTAERIFGRADAVGETLYDIRNQTMLTIAAVYEDFPENQSLKNGIYVYLPYDENEGNYNYHTYFLIDPEAVPKVERFINSEEFLGKETIEFFNANPDSRETMYLSALGSMHLYSERAGGMRQINSTLSLLAIGVLVMLIAWINFINLAMAMAPSRVRSINIHKILGIGKRNLRIAIAFEGVWLTLIALALALAAVHGFSATPMAGLFNSPLALGANIPIIAGVAAVSVAVAFLVGMYAARYTTGFDVAIALKSSFALSGGAGKLRNVLIVVQFTAAMALISVAAMVKMQHDYMTGYSWGLQKENIVCVNAAVLGVANWETVGAELKTNPNIVDWTVADALPGQIGMSWGRNFEGKHLNNFTVWSVYPNFLRFFDVAVTEGEDFPLEPGAKQSVIFNQELVDMYELTPDDIGKDFYCFEPGVVRGFCENVHFESMHEPLKPMAFAVVNSTWGYYYIKITGRDIPASLAHIENVWKKFSDEPLQVKFLDDEMDSLYRGENNIARLIGLFGLATVIIAMMGVYGLIFFNARYRTKEIAIRRVNGAETGEIVTMLNGAMFAQLAVAFVLATGIALFVIRNWLNGFAYKAPVPWWLFLLAGVVVAATSLATVSWQSLRAATANPVNSLKSE